MRAQGPTDLSLDEAVDQPAHDREQRAGRKPFGLLPPHGAERRRGLAPAPARCDGGGAREQPGAPPPPDRRPRLSWSPARSSPGPPPGWAGAPPPPRDASPPPAWVALSSRDALAARAACGGSLPRGARGLGATARGGGATAAAWSSPLLPRYGGFCGRPARPPWGLDTLAVGGHRRGGLAMAAGLHLGWLLARGRACTPPQRRASQALRPSLYSTAPRRLTLCPCQRRGASAVVRPGCSPRRGQADGGCPQAARAWRTAQVRGTQGTTPRPGASPTPRGRRLQA